MFELEKETPFPLAEVANLSWLPCRAKGPRLHPTTLFRWATNGLRRPDRTRVRLETIKFGGRLYTSEAAVKRFFRLLSRQEEVTVA